jgi:hypothetical protein
MASVHYRAPVQRMLLTTIRLFALQSLLLALIEGIIAFFHNA